MPNRSCILKPCRLTTFHASFDVSRLNLFPAKIGEIIPSDQSFGINPEEKIMLKSFVKAESILFFENFKNSFKMRSEEQALFSFKQLMLFRTSCSVMGELIFKLCSETRYVAEWLAHRRLVLEVPGSISAGGEENLLVRTCFPSCHLQE